MKPGVLPPEECGIYAGALSFVGNPLLGFEDSDGGRLALRGDPRVREHLADCAARTFSSSASGASPTSSEMPFPIRSQN